MQRQWKQARGNTFFSLLDMRGHLVARGRRGFHHHVHGKSFRLSTHRNAEGPNEADGLGVLLRGLRRLWHDGSVHTSVAIGCVLQERFRLTALLIMLQNKDVCFKGALNAFGAVKCSFFCFEKLTCCWGGLQLTSSGSEWKTQTGWDSDIKHLRRSSQV